MRCMVGECSLKEIGQARRFVSVGALNGLDCGGRGAKRRARGGYFLRVQKRKGR